MIASHWEPLKDKSGKRCIIWEYDVEDPRWVIYRFVWETPGIPWVVFYVGSGLNLNSRRGRTVSLTRQYKHGNRKLRLKLPMEEELSQKGGEFWTEILHIDDKELEEKIDRECQSGTDDGLRTIENYLIFSSFCDYIKIYSDYGHRIFAFHNDKIEKLFDILKFL